MSVRVFDGSDDRIRFAAGDANVSGAFSIVALIKPLTANAGTVSVGISSGGILLASLAQGGGSKVASFTSTQDSDNFGVTYAIDEWNIAAVTKAAGTAAPRLHAKQLDSGGWLHGVGGSTIDPSALEPDAIVLGGMTPNGAGVQDCQLAVVALFDFEVSDGDIEAIQTLSSTQYLVDLGASSVWELNQASTATAVPDLVGESEQSAITGTTVIEGDDPDWTYGATVVPPLECTVRLSGGAANSAPSASIGGAESSEPAPLGLFDEVSNSERTSGVTDYRCEYLHNEDPDDDGTAIAWIHTNLESGRALAIGAAPEDAGEDAEVIDDDQTAPTGVSFSAPSVPGGGIDLGLIPAGTGKAVWVRRTVNSGSPVDPTNIGQIRFQILRTE